MATAAVSRVDSHKFGLFNGGPPPQTHLTASAVRETTDGGQPLRSYPPLHPRGQPGPSADFVLHRDGSGVSPRPPPVAPPQGATPPKGHSPGGKGTVSQLARYVQHTGAALAA
jgi:hypothetical protein